MASHSRSRGHKPSGAEAQPTATDPRPPVRRRLHTHKAPPRRLIATWLGQFFTRARTLIALALLLAAAFAARGALHFLRADAKPGWGEYIPPAHTPVSPILKPPPASSPPPPAAPAGSRNITTSPPISPMAPAILSAPMVRASSIPACPAH